MSTKPLGDRHYSRGISKQKPLRFRGQVGNSVIFSISFAIHRCGPTETRQMFIVPSSTVSLSAYETTFWSLYPTHCIVSSRLYRTDFRVFYLKSIGERIFFFFCIDSGQTERRKKESSRMSSFGHNLWVTKKERKKLFNFIFHPKTQLNLWRFL